MGDPLPMVSSSTGAMNSLLEKLMVLEFEHPQLAEGLRERLETLNHALHSFAGRRAARDGLTNEWMLQVREVAYDMEDWLDGSLIGPSILDTDVWEQMEEFEAQIRDAEEGSARYGLPISTEPEPTSAQDAGGDVAVAVAAVDPDLLHLHGEAPCLVGISEPMSVLVNYLTDAEQRRKVVCILGPGGVGKTALATQVYRELQGQFSCGAFVHLGRNPSVKTALISILKQVMPEWWQYQTDLWSGYNYDDMGAWDEKNVVAKLWAFLKKRSYFVVLDDVWSIRTWKVISGALPNNDKAADRILITTCKKDVKESCCIHPNDAVYRMEGLKENSKILFDSKIPSSEKQSLLEGCDEMLKMCGGMPLAITIAAGLLLRKSACLPLDQYHSKQQGMRNILEISYDDLTLPLKSCFLYLSAFPQSCTIKKDRLIRRWGAEGFIPKRNGESLWETGESYFNELISRRLIQLVFDDDDDQPTGCTVHDDVFAFIESLSAEENFVTAGAKLKSGLFLRDRVRRVCLDCDEDDEGDTLFSSTYCPLKRKNRVDSNDEENSSSDKDEAISLPLSQVRSLAFYGDVRRIPDLSDFKFVRVLDLTDGTGLENEQLRSIGCLYLLRYLGLGGTKITKLPQQIMKLDHLSTLDLRQTKVKKLPDCKGSKLVSLLANGLTMPRGIEGMENLEELSTVCLGGNVSLPKHVGELVHKLRGLRMLGVKFSNIAKEEEEGLKHFLEEVGRSNLQFLFLDEYPHHLLGLLLDSWTHDRPRCLRKFELRMDWLHFFRYPQRVPQAISFLEDLTHLHIGVLEVEAQGVRALGSLPKLVLLKLYSYSSPRFSVSSKDGFQCLKVFWYCCEHGAASGLQFEAEAMPQLRRLLLDLNASATDFVSGIWHLSCLVQVRATIYCGPTSTASALEANIRGQVSENPNKPLLELNRKSQGRLLPRPEPPSTVKPPEESVVEIQDLDEWYIQIEEAESTNKLVVVEFTATWCKPSRSIAPVFAELASKFPDVVFLKVDIDEMKHIAENFEVTGAPVFLFMKGGQVRDRLRGAQTEELKQKLKEQMAQ